MTTATDQPETNALQTTESREMESSESNSHEDRPVFRPHVDIVQNEREVVLIADVPGVSEAETDVRLEKNVLTISARVELPKFDGYTPVYREYKTGDYERTFHISDEIDRDKIDASVRNGVLRVVLPKSPEVTKQVSVRRGE